MKRIPPVFFLMALGIAAYGIWYSVGCIARDAQMRHGWRDFDAIHSVLKMFEHTTGAMPTTEEGLRALVDRPPGWPEDRRWERLMDRVPIDPCGNEYRYARSVVDGRNWVKVRSAGADGRDGTRDDLERVEECREVAR